MFPGPALSQVKLRPCRGFPKSNGAIALGDSAARRAKGVGSWISMISTVDGQKSGDQTTWDV